MPSTGSPHSTGLPPPIVNNNSVSSPPHLTPSYSTFHSADNTHARQRQELTQKLQSYLRTELNKVSAERSNTVSLKEMTDILLQQKQLKEIELIHGIDFRRHCSGRDVILFEPSFSKRQN
eukprot:TRINITY_DN2229_c0_g1_i5.p1 TRINITY_DN2229_c0_g1~~TRINITY_DN2229_c0_g1_i5.p1  ORF type:complete len:120 (-),score=18.94 TRINITY_DN2229_c0_g1_i5:148-507(-)